ncbi:DUF4244 domain-containing protein [Actinokineospora sp. NPDC004072]
MQFLYRLLRRDTGMTTAEYALGTVAAAAFAALLYGILTGDHILDRLTSLISNSLEEP